MHTTVALKLSAGQTRAANTTRKRARFTTSLPCRPCTRIFAPPRGRPDRRRPAGPRAMPEARAMAQGFTPSGIAAHTGPTVRPAERIVKSSHTSTLKSQSVVFGISRPTRTPTEGSPQGGEAADRGLDCNVQSPGTGCRQPVAPRPHVRSLQLHCSRGPVTQRTRPGSSSRAAGETHGPGDGPEASFRVSRPTVHPAGRKRYWDNLAGREVEPAIRWPQSA
jgi:hypothetical protein